jgi:hypothetical protein
MYDDVTLTHLGTHTKKPSLDARENILAQYKVTNAMYLRELESG